MNIQPTNSDYLQSFYDDNNVIQDSEAERRNPDAENEFLLKPNDLTMCSHISAIPKPNRLNFFFFL